MVKYHEPYESSSTERLREKGEPGTLSSLTEEPLKSVRLSLKQEAPEPFNEMIKRNFVRSEKQSTGKSAGRSD